MPSVFGEMRLCCIRDTALLGSEAREGQIFQARPAFIEQPPITQARDSANREGLAPSALGSCHSILWQAH